VRQRGGMKGGVGGSYKISLAIHALYVGNPLKLGPRAENREGGDPMKKSGNQFFKMNSSPVPLQFPACLPALKYQHPILHLKAVRAPLRFSVGDDPRMNANCCPTYVCAVACTVSRSNETSSLLDGYVRTTITIILKLRMGEDEERSREHRSTFFSCILLILLPTIA